MEPKKLLFKTLIQTLINKTLINKTLINETLVFHSFSTKTPNKKWQIFTENSKIKQTPTKTIQKGLKIAEWNQHIIAKQPVITEDIKPKATIFSKQVQKAFKTVQYSEDICNSASFIGTVNRPVQRFETKSGFGAMTSLLVKSSSNNRTFRIFLILWDKMAEMSLEHIKENDLLHVSGRVESYTKSDENNLSQTYYQVVVKEINYVAESEHSPTGKYAKQLDSKGESEYIPTVENAEQLDPRGESEYIPTIKKTEGLDPKGESEYIPTIKNAEQLDPKGESGYIPTIKKAERLDSKGGESWVEKERARLRLWQLFFTNPSEWHDNRKTKPKPTYPDFKNKNTGEAIWMNARDPSWVKKQLQELDSRPTIQGHKEDASSTFSPFI